MCTRKWIGLNAVMAIAVFSFISRHTSARAQDAAPFYLSNVSHSAKADSKKSDALPRNAVIVTEQAVPCECGEKEEKKDEAPQFGGPFLTRDKMTGDWFGLRTGLAENGITLDVYGTSFTQGVTSGGRVQDWETGGKFDYLLNVDGEKLGLWQGFFVNLHAESRLGKSVNTIDGLLLPSNLAMAFPKEDENITSITGIKFTQALSESFAVFFGKLNTLDEYPLRFSPALGLGRPGIGGFMNTSLVFNPVMARTIPYSTAAVGGAVLMEGEPIFTLTVMDPEERTTRGFENLYERGVVIVPDFIFRTKLLGRPGLYNIGGTYSNSKYRSVDPAAYLFLPNLGVVGARETGSWCVYSNFYQALWVDPCDEKRTWGLFGQFGISDGNPNPIRFTSNGGIAGRSMLPGRKLDTFGAGFFYIGLSGSFKALAAPINPQQDEYGVELFYNVAVTPWCRLTFDFQAVNPSTQAFGTSIIPGLRLSLNF